MADAKLLLVLVGLPARGKSYVAIKLSSFLGWRGIRTRTFNVGVTRRSSASGQQSADFFSATNVEAKAKREALALGVLHDALDWMEDGGGGGGGGGGGSASEAVAILDATNTTADRRRRVQQAVADYYRTPARAAAVRPSIVFVECICTDAATLHSNMLQKVTNSPDFRGMPLDKALSDLAARIAEYEKVYETVDEAKEDALSPFGRISYIKTMDLQSKIICRNISGSIAMLIVSFVMVIHIGARPIYIVRAGHCNDNAVRAMITRNAARSRTARRSAVEAAAAAAAAVADGASGVTPASTSPTTRRRTLDDTASNSLHEEDVHRRASSAAATAAARGGRASSGDGLSSSPERGGIASDVDSNASLPDDENDELTDNVLRSISIKSTTALGGDSFVLSPLYGALEGDASHAPDASSTRTRAHLVSISGSSAGGVDGREDVDASTGRSLAGDGTVYASQPDVFGLKVPQIYADLAAALSPSATTTALSAGLTLDKRGIAFAEQVTDFVLRRTSGGRLSRTKSEVMPIPPPLAPLPAVDAYPAPPALSAGTDASGSLAGNVVDVTFTSSASLASSPATRLSRSSTAVHITHVSVSEPVRPLRVLGSPDSATVSDHVGCAATAARVDSLPARTSADMRVDVPAPTHEWEEHDAMDAGKLSTRSERSDAGRAGAGAEFTVRRLKSKRAPAAGADEPGTAGAWREDRAGLDAAALGQQPAPLPPRSPLHEAHAAATELSGEEDSDAAQGIVASSFSLAQASHYGKAPPIVADSAELMVFDAPPAIYTSTLPRTIGMVASLPFSSTQLSALNPMETGICLGIPLQHLEAQFPEVYASWSNAPDRARYRIPGGESLMDVVARLSSVVIEIERQRQPVVIFTHLSICQVLLAYFKNVPLADCVSLDFPMNTVIEFTPHQYGWLERRFTFSAVDAMPPS